MASRQAPKASTPTTIPNLSDVSMIHPIPCYMSCLLFLSIITLAAMSKPALAGGPSPPSNFVIYSHMDETPPDATIVEVATPSGNLTAVEFGPEFGSTFVVADVLREGVAADSPVLGVLDGLVLVEKDLSDYLSITYVLSNLYGFTGTISAQGILAAPGNGELAVTGGTNDFRWARGYIDVTSLSQDREDAIFKTIFYVKYD